MGTNTYIIPTKTTQLLKKDAYIYTQMDFWFQNGMLKPITSSKNGEICITFKGGQTYKTEEREQTKLALCK